MIRRWWPQIVAVIRLEMRKTFFARRGLWVYLLALAPVLIWAVHAIDVSRSRESQTSRQVSKAALDSIEIGMTVDQVLDKLGEPDSRGTFRGRRQETEVINYSDVTRSRSAMANFTAPTAASCAASRRIR
jgi:hypothetical protein